MTYVETVLKVPDDGAWVALTLVGDDATATPLGYINADELRSAATTLFRMYVLLEDAPE